MARCPGCDVVNRDGAGACENCGSAIAVVCDQCGAGNPGLARFCCGCGGRLTPPSEPFSSPSSRPERRQITVLFCDLVDSSQLARQLDPEDWHHLVHRVHSQCGEIIAKHRGHVAQYLGDGLLAYFGYPVAAEDAARQAVATGLHVTREISDIGNSVGTRLRVRLGIHSGPVVVASVGATLHRESLAFGEAPYLAFRVQEVAPPGAVVLSAETHRLVEGYFETRELGLYRLKGFETQGLKLYQVTGEKGVTSRIEAASSIGLTRLVGRRTELAALEEAWRSTTAGAAPVLLLTGEAGIGKSRLIHMLRTFVGNAVPFVELRCSEHAKTSAFHPMLECLQRHAALLHGEPAPVLKAKLKAQLDPVGLTSDHVALVASLLGAPLDPLPLSPERQRAAMLEALSAWVMGRVEDDPRVVVVEDLHLADPSTLELLSLLPNQSASRRLLMVGSTRPESHSPWTTVERLKTLPLNRFDGQDSRAVIARISGDKPLPEELLDRLVTRAEGIPLFLEEMTKATLASGVLRETSTGYALTEESPDRAIPMTLHDSLRGPLDQLGPKKIIAQLAAVLGRKFSYPLFEAVWRRIPSEPEVNLADGLEALVASQLIASVSEPPEVTYQFRHSLIREVAYQSLLRSTQREYHLHAAQALAEDFPALADIEPEVVAHHFSAARRGEMAVEYWSKAGERAIRASAYAEAISHFGAALDQLATTPTEPARLRREVELRSRLGLALITTRGFAATEVEDTYTRASELCASLGAELPLRVLYGTWATNLVRGDLSSTLRMLPTLERLAEQRSDPASGLAVNAMLGAWSFFRGDYGDAIQRNTSALKHCRRDRPKEQHKALVIEHGFEGFLYPALYLAWSQAFTGDIEAARETWREAAAISETIGDPYVAAGVFAFGAAMNHDLGDRVAAADLARRTRELCQEKGFVLWLAIAIIISGSCAWTSGTAEESIATIQKGLKILNAIGDRHVSIYYASYLADAYLKSGRALEAADVLEAALKHTRVHVAKFCQPELLRLLGEARLAQGQLDVAGQCLVSALELSRAQGARLSELRVATSLAETPGPWTSSLDLAGALSRTRRSFDARIQFPWLDRADELLQRVHVKEGK